MNYLYNGKGPLPDIFTFYTPEKQAELPYAALRSGEKSPLYGGHLYRIYLTNKPIQNEGGHSCGIDIVDGDLIVEFYGLLELDGEWFYTGRDDYTGTRYTHTDIADSTNPIVWANYNIYNSYGGIYLAASAPVPVYSGISIRCPDSVRQGLFIIVACDSPEQPYVDFTCTLSGHTSSRTKLMQNTDKTLRLQCGSDEGASELLLEVESGGATASKAIKVIPYTPVGPGSGDSEYDTDSKVTDISLLAFPDTVAPGGYSIMLISVNGEGNYSQRITAEISGHTSADTQYFSDGYFCNIAVGKDETAESILVTITSAQDPSVSASVWVNVDHSGDTPLDPGTDEERLQRAFWKGFAAGIPG